MNWNLQDVSYWNMPFKLALTDRNMQARICLKVVLISWDYISWVSSTSFQKSNIDWPLTEKVSISVKNWIFDDPFHIKEPVLVISVLGMIQPSGSGCSLMKWGCKGHWGHQGCWSCRGHWDWWRSKAWKITTEDFILMFYKKNIFW